MAKQLSGLMRALSQALPMPRVLALLPLALLCGFWAMGETALVIGALAVPMSLAVVCSIQAARAMPGAAMSEHSATREELAAWLDTSLAAGRGRRGKVAVLTMVIDDLQGLESRLGRAAGRGVLKALRRRLATILRQDDIVAHLDDDILAIGLRGIRGPETETLLSLARRLQSVTDTPFPVGSARVWCSVSVGVATERHVRTEGGAAMISAAVGAGEFAAASGNGAVRLFTEGIVSEREEERARTRALADALETGEIFAWFQPQMTADGKRLFGFEALARWDRPDHGLMPPAGFLPDIRTSGLCQRLTEVILKQALAALNAWDAAGHDVPTVSVNFSDEELRNPHLADYVLWELERFGLKPDRLVVEVLESVIADQHEEAITRTLLALSEAGCRIDLDDFGTGSTSILNIRRFNVSRIKIDRQLVTGLDGDRDQRRMVSALLSFSSRLGIETLAEGVETDAERETLRRIGCPLIQGYVAAKPMPLGETLLWLDGIERPGDDSDPAKSPARPPPVFAGIAGLP